MGLMPRRGLLLGLAGAGIAGRVRAQAAERFPDKPMTLLVPFGPGGIADLTAREALAAPATRDKMAKLGVRLQGSTPAQLQALLASEVQRWGSVIRAAKIEPE